MKTRRRVIVKEEIKEKKLEKKIAEETISVTSLHEAIALQKQGYIVTDVKSEIGGIRLKTWVLKK